MTDKLILNKEKEWLELSKIHGEEKIAYPILVEHRTFGNLILIRADGAGAICKNDNFQIVIYDVFSPDWLAIPFPNFLGD